MQSAANPQGRAPAVRSPMTTIDLRDIISLTDFQRNAKQHIVRLTRTGKAQVLTINGKAELVVQDAAAYQKLLDQAEAGRNKTLSIVAGAVPPPPAAGPPLIESKPDAAMGIASAMQELRKNFSTGGRKR